MTRPFRPLPAPADRSHRPSFRPRPEALEGRQLLSADPGWTFGIGGSTNDMANDLAPDQSGNVFVTGSFTGTVDFDPDAAGSSSLTSAGGYDAFVTKYSPTGALLWARRMGGSGSDSGSSIAIHKDPITGSDFVYVTGSFSGTVDFGGEVRVSAGGKDIYVAKTNATDGSLIWVNTMGGAANDLPNAITTGPDGSAFVTGDFYGTASFGPSLSLTPSGTSGGSDIFVAKLDANGLSVWARRAGGGADDSAKDITTYSEPATGAQFLYLTGAFSVTASFGNATLSASSSGMSDTFVWKMAAADGSTQWAKGVDGPVIDGGVGIAVDASGAVYTTGYFDQSSVAHQYNGPVDFDPGPGTSTLSSSGDADGFLWKLDGAGNFVWARAVGGSGYDDGARVVTYGDDVYVTGSFTGLVDFDPGPDTFQLSGVAAGQEFLWRLDTSGAFLDAWKSGGIAGYSTGGLATYRDSVTGVQSVYIAGRFSGTAAFPTGTSLTSAGGEDGYVLRLNPNTPGFRISPGSGLVTTEGGGVTSFTVALKARPTADVTIPVSSSNTAEGTVSTSLLTFTPSNWDVAQAVTITGVDDTIVDGNIAYAIVLGTTSSADTDYNGLDPADVSASNTDNDLPPTKFYVVDDASTDRTYKYGAVGAAVENYALGSGNTAPRGAAGTIAGTTTWVIDANRKIYVYDTSGGLLGSWTAGGLASNAMVEGIATNGTDIWNVDAKQDKVFRYSNAAGLRSGSQNAASSFNLNSGNASPKDIVTDGVNLWVVNDSSTDKVFKYTLSGTLVGSWTITSAGSSPTGITLDPSGGGTLWIVDSGTRRVYQFDNARGLTSGSQSPSSSFALAAGNTNPQGIADPPVGPSLAAATPRPAVTARHAANGLGATQGHALFALAPDRDRLTFGDGPTPAGPRALRHRHTASRRHA